MQRWCKYCKVMTPPTPGHAGRPTMCSICHHPYNGHVMAPPEAEAFGRPEHAELPSTPPGSAPPVRACLYLRDRNNCQTVHLYPHKHNACYARLRQQQPWWRSTVTVTPTPVDRAYQVRYCLGNYASCPFFRRFQNEEPTSRVA